jgi:hypothetical protein
VAGAVWQRVILITRLSTSSFAHCVGISSVAILLLFFTLLYSLYYALSTTPSFTNMLTNNWTKVLLAGIALLSIFGNVAANQKLSADELVKYHQNLERDAGALSQCLQSPEMHDHNVRMLARREQTLHNLRKAHGIDVNSGNIHMNLMSTPLLSLCRSCQAQPRRREQVDGWQP